MPDIANKFLQLAYVAAAPAVREGRAVRGARRQSQGMVAVRLPAQRQGTEAR